MNEEIDTVRTAITALPDLLQRLLTATEANTERLDNLRREGQETRDNLEEMDEQLTLLLNENKETERPPSPTDSIRSRERESTPFFRKRRTSSPPPRKEKPKTEEIPRGAKAKKPDAFEGKRRDQAADIFLMRMEVYFNDYPGAFDDHKKITAALSNMKEGDATRWAQPLLKRLLEGREHPALRSWQTFKEAFLLAFGDPIKKERTIRDMQKLVQTKSAQDYASAFRILMDNVNWDEKALIDRFRNGLKDTVRKELIKSTFMHDTDNLPLERWIELAIKTDDILFSMRDRDTTPKFQGRAASETSERKRPEYISEAESKLGKDELSRRLKGRLCLKCAKKGH